MVICPKCKSNRVAPIIYGYPRAEAMEAFEREEIYLGGCEMIDGQVQKDYGCFACRYEWATDTLPGTAVIKIRYKVTEQGLCTLDMQRRWVYEIFPGGLCRMYTYVGTSRKYMDKEVVEIDSKRVAALTEHIQKILGAPLWKRNIVDAVVCDGCGYDLQISYTDNRKKKISGDVGGGTFDTLMEEFVDGIFGKRWGCEEE